MAIHLNSLFVFCNALIFVYSQPLESNCYLGEEAKKINERLLKEHNNYRTMHGVPPLQIDYQLMKGATTWSNQLAKENKIRTSDVKDEGENLYGAIYSGHLDESMIHPTEIWYKGGEKYNGSYSPDSGHFSQIVWKNSKKLGCGVCSSTNLTVVTCRYSPAGNIMSEELFKENVPPVLRPQEGPMESNDQGPC